MGAAQEAFDKLESDASDVAAGVVSTSKDGNGNFTRVDKNSVFRLGPFLGDGRQRLLGKLKCICRRLCDYLGERLRIARSKVTGKRLRVNNSFLICDVGVFFQLSFLTKKLKQRKSLRRCESDGKS